MLFEDTYRTISKESTGIYKEKGSKFLAFALPVNTEEEIKSELERFRKTYYDARHHCYAYILGYDKSAWRVNDDGEPSGTGGRPIYGQLLSNDLTNVLVVVVRYFGGIKLGVSGLIQAYRAAAADAIANADIVEETIKETYELQFKYEQMNNVMKVLKEDEAEILDTEFDLSCKIIIQIRRSMADKIIKKLQHSYGCNIIYR
ncbi:MAG: YigZ family protein [Lentimicrobiaceae bacterium]|nr:YigZ family protein [Lentimicrobiaceae bacterium]